MASPEMTNLADLLSRAAGEHPSRVAIKLDDSEVSYAALDQAASRAAALLTARGVQAGDRVGIMLPNVAYFPICYYGALRSGAAVVPMNVLLKEREVAFHLGDSGAKVLLAWHQVADVARAGAEQTDAECVLVEPGEFERLLERIAPAQDVVERRPEDTAVLLYTSGTTGTPKGAELTHHNLLRNVEITVELFGLDERSVTLGALPLFHAFGQTCALNATVSVGGCLTLITRFDAGKALEILERDRVTLFEGVPTMYAAMLHDPRADATDASALQVCVSGGAALPVEIMRAFEQKFKCQILEAYGLSETSPVASSNRRDRERKPGSIGLPIDGVEMRVIDDRGSETPQGEVGEVAIRGHNIMKGYWQQDDATAAAIDADGWFRTGDLATVDAEGYFFIVDRMKDLVIRGGYNVYPREVEEVLYEHPDVSLAAVIGIPHDELGEEVGAAIVLKSGADTAASTLRDFVKQRIAAYKYPRHIWFVDDLPLGPSGKILKREITPPAALTQAEPERLATLDDLEVDGRRVLVRADLNVPLESGLPGGGLRVADDSRIRAALTTLEELRRRNARIVLVSHLGRPDGRDPLLSMRPVADRVAELTDAPVRLAPAVIGPHVRALSEQLVPGEILMLENVRYEPGETRNEQALVSALAELADVYVNDAFGTAHRAHASTEGIAHRLPSAAGRLMEHEVEVLSSIIERPERPLVAILGGAKVSDKIGVVDRFLKIADVLCVGGAMCFPFLAAQGHTVGMSRCAEADIASARQALMAAAGSRCRLELPSDLVLAERAEDGAEPRALDGVDVPDACIGLDIGPRTAQRFAREIAAAGTAFWNGPMGRFELAPFAAGTHAIADALAASTATTVVGGGETVEALTRDGLEGSVTHVSTGGGATLALLEGRPLPGVKALTRAPDPERRRPSLAGAR